MNVAAMQPEAAILQVDYYYQFYITKTAYVMHVFLYT